MNNKYLIIILISTAFIAGVFYFLYTTCLNRPQIKTSEQGYRVQAQADFPKRQLPIRVYRNNQFINEFQGTGQHFIEYMAPGTHTYKFEYRAKNLLGIKRKFHINKQFTIDELTEKQLQQHFSFPSIILSNSEYKVYLSYPNLKKFTKISILEDNEKISSISATSTEKQFIGHAEPGEHTYKIIFNSPQYKNLEGFLHQSYKVEVEPIQPQILSLEPEPLYQGYSSEVTVQVEDASECKAELLLFPPGRPEGTPSVLKSHNFTVDDLDYFYQHDESWDWKEILFPEPTDKDTSGYNMDLKFTCSDYYNSTSTQQTIRFPTTRKLVPTSITVSHYKQQATPYAKIENNTWKDLNCRVMLGDDKSYELGKKSFTVQSYQAHSFSLKPYQEGLLYIAAICNDDQNRAVTNIIKYQPQ